MRSVDLKVNSGEKYLINFNNRNNSIKTVGTFVLYLLYTLKKYCMMENRDQAVGILLNWFQANVAFLYSLKTFGFMFSGGTEK